MSAQRDRWRVRLLSREALLNCFAPHARLYPLVLIAAVLGIAGPVLATWQSQQLQHQLAAEAMDGRSLIALSALDKNDPATINVASCTSLITDNDVVAAGTVQPVKTANFLQLGTSIPVLEASPTLLPQLQTHRALVGSALTKRAQPFTLLLPTGESLGAIRATRQPDALGSNGAVTIALPPTVRSTSTCYVKIVPTADANQVGARLVTEIDATGGPIAATSAFSEPQNPIAVFAHRVDRYLPVMLGIVGGLLAGTINRRRAGEWAAYRMSGTSSRSMGLIIGLELSFQAGLMLLSGAIAVVSLSARTVAPQSSILLALAAAGAWVISGLIATADLPYRKPNDLAKDR